MEKHAIFSAAKAGKADFKGFIWAVPVCKMHVHMDTVHTQRLQVTAHTCVYRALRQVPPVMTWHRESLHHLCSELGFTACCCVSKFTVIWVIFWDSTVAHSGKFLPAKRQQQTCDILYSKLHKMLPLVKVPTSNTSDLDLWGYWEAKMKIPSVVLIRAKWSELEATWTLDN